MCRLQPAVDVSADARRLFAQRSYGANDSGVRGRAGSGETEVQDSDSRGRASELQCKPAVEGLAVRVRHENPDDAGAGAGLHGSGGDAMADGNAKAGPYDPMAVLAGQPESPAKGVQEAAGNCGGVEFHRHGGAGNRWDQDRVAGIGTAGLAPGSTGKDLEAVGCGDQRKHQTHRAGGQARPRLPATGRIAAAAPTARENSGSTKAVG